MDMNNKKSCSWTMNKSKYKIPVFDILYSCFSYKNTFYKKLVAEKCPKFKNMPRTCCTRFFFNKNQQLPAEAGLFLFFWRFQPKVVLKLFLFPDTSKQSISCPEQ